MSRLPQIDMHAHIEADIPASDLTNLGALVFAATRSLDEAEGALRRRDAWTVWGVGCHPGLVGAQKAFETDRFASLSTSTPYVSEVGLDGKSRVPMEMQRATFAAVLSVLQASPRITSIHSYAAIDDVLDCLDEWPIHGAVLHWWLGSPAQTRRAVDRDCFFSVNAAMLRQHNLVSRIPLDRVLPETDHPFGDRSGGDGRRPGRVGDVELALAQIHQLTPEKIRQTTWRNLGELIRNTRCGMLLPRQARVTLAAS
ncbi:TatD family hydrolase [Actinorhabdospora filicis]|uniref:TatD family hydrolase n=1 Tax=Actinorhabdospora filicis TaxID=1785913 RepID=A0A9W6W9V3_9ACTN|nr:TatD family hydrolase [Actinorhabdospora filicis]GLZ77946.1 TatD family hydrolase [Actinorhabdospora filicis]